MILQGFHRNVAVTAAKLSRDCYRSRDVFLEQAMRRLDDIEGAYVFARHGVLGYYLVTPSFAYLIFTGTNDMVDVKRDLRCRWSQSWDALMLCDPAEHKVPRVHTGFQSAWDEIRCDVLDTVEAHPPQGPLIIAGHSLGGAIAVLAAVGLFGIGIKSSVYTFGAPRVGDRAFRKLCNKGLALNHFRVEQAGDVVPHLPPFLLGFRHTGILLYVTRDGRLRTRATPVMRVRLALRGLFRWLDITSHDIADYTTSLGKGLK